MEGHNSDRSCDTTPHYWDCECDQDYIHPASQHTCECCQATRDAQPDARVDEVQQMLNKESLC